MGIFSNIGPDFIRPDPLDLDELRVVANSTIADDLINQILDMRKVGLGWAFLIHIH
jgi:hypothetical protein